LEDYLNPRLWKWIGKNKAFDKRLTPAFLVLGTVSIVSIIPEFFVNFMVFICLAFMTYSETDPRKSAKKKLVLTTRAKRIYFPALILVTVSGALCFWNSSPFLWILNVQLIMFSLLIINSLLQPFEAIIQQGYWNDAKVKMNQFQPTVIAITGSFGKTSVKHILGHILKTQASTLITPGSVNTPMGITRIIREQLDESHKYFIVEMGAYGPGSIARLCKLTPPDYGIITTIGHAHYERFRSLETVCQAKFELAEAVIEKGGKAVIHERTKRFSHAREMRIEHPDHFIVCGEPPEIDPAKRKDVNYLEKTDWHIVSVEQLATGLELKLSKDGKPYGFEIPLYGIHHGHNAALAITLALELGMGPLAIIQALKSLPQIQHRLEVKRQPDGTRLIDDAYNSNPLGFRSALDLMAIIQNSSGRNILITPGMVELGSAHNEVHEKIGTYAGEICDVAIVVSSKRIPTFIRGFQKTGASKTLIEVDSFEDATKWLSDNRKEGDIILLENDLPDIYERVPKM